MEKHRTYAPEDTRRTLLEAAFREIHAQGFRGASLQQILDDTGFTKGALYHHFPTKQALGLAVIDEIVRARFDAGLLKPLRESARPVATLGALLADPPAFLATDEGIRLGCPLNNLVQEMSAVDPEFQHHLQVVLGAWVAVIEEALDRGQSQGDIDPEVDRRAAALFIVSAWEGCRGTAKARQSPADFKHCLGEIARYLRSLAPC